MGFFHRIGKPVNLALSDAYYYHAWKNKIVYSPMGNWFELGYKELEADPVSFMVLSNEFGKDRTSIFWKGNPQKVHHPSFTVDAQRIPRDSFHVYNDFGYGDSLFVIDDADPKSYEPFQLNKDLYYNHWGRDKKSIFIDGKRIDVDRATFVLLNNSLAADTASFYSIEMNFEHEAGKPEGIQVVKRAPNPGGVPHVISDTYLQIDNAIVMSNWKNVFSMITFDRIDSVKVIDERNIVINSTILVSDGDRLPGVDIPSMEILSRDFFKDKFSVYYDRNKIALADPLTFTLVSEYYSKDEKHAFYKAQVLEGVEPEKFTYENSTDIAGDGKLKFKEGVKLF